jgi:hypothetical protein
MVHRYQDVDKMAREAREQVEDALLERDQAKAREVGQGQSRESFLRPGKAGDDLGGYRKAGRLSCWGEVWPVDA